MQPSAQYSIMSLIRVVVCVSDSSLLCVTPLYEHAIGYPFSDEHWDCVFSFFDEHYCSTYLMMDIYPHFFSVYT